MEEEENAAEKTLHLKKLCRIHSRGRKKRRSMRESLDFSSVEKGLGF